MLVPTARAAPRGAWPAAWLRTVDCVVLVCACVNGACPPPPESRVLCARLFDVIGVRARGVARAPRLRYAGGTPEERANAVALEHEFAGLVGRETRTTRIITLCAGAIAFGVAAVGTVGSPDFPLYPVGLGVCLLTLAGMLLSPRRANATMAILFLPLIAGEECGSGPA